MKPKDPFWNFFTISEDNKKKKKNPKKQKNNWCKVQRLSESKGCNNT